MAVYLSAGTREYRGGGNRDKVRFLRQVLPESGNGGSTCRGRSKAEGPLMTYARTTVRDCPSCHEVRAGHEYVNDRDAAVAMWICPVCGGQYDPLDLPDGFEVSP